MGGHKVGGQKGHHGSLTRRKGGRNCHPDDRPQFGKALDVPGDDLRKAGARLAANKNKREEAVRNIRAAKTLQRTAFVSGAQDKQKLAALALQAIRGQSAHAGKLAAQVAAASASGGPRASGPDLSLKKYSKEFKTVIEMSDILLQVLDARDPLGCRLFDFEMAIRSQYGDSKTIVVILNKADMVPDANALQQWVNYFADQDIAAIPFSAKSSGANRAAFGQSVPEVFRLLRKLARVDETSSARKSVTVGVIGYPNVGKSSTINALKGKAVVGVGNMPGITTGNTEVDLRGDIKIIDCPGVVVRGANGADVVLRNATKISDVEDPLIVVEEALNRTDLDVLCAVYGVPIPPVTAPNRAAEFIRAVALRRGSVRSGGLLELTNAARLVLKDWNDGRIVHYTYPPDADDFANADIDHEISDGPEVIRQLTASKSTLPRIVVVPPQGATAATWAIPESKKFTGKIKYHPTDTSSDDEDEADADSDAA